MKQQIEYIATEKLIPYARNSRTHSDEQVAQICSSINEFGFTNPVLIDADDVIIAGHGRTMAAHRLQIKELPCLRLSHLTEAQKQAYVIADNKLALNAGWNDEMLKIELQELKDADFDLSLTGFDDTELADLMAEAVEEGLVDEDQVPDEPEKAVSVIGDVWLLGKHKIICGDATQITVWQKLLGDIKPHLMVTDPPYGVEYDANWRNEAERGNGKSIGGRAVGKVLNDDKASWLEVWTLFEGDVCYIWHADRFSHVIAQDLNKCDFDLRALIIWAKNNMVIGRGHYHSQHEPCWYAVRKKRNGHWQGDRKQKTLWHIDKPMKSETGHSTQKPVECMERPIVNNSSIGQAIIDPFCGSGTTLIAAEKTARQCFGIELNPKYVDVIVKRWQDYTGRQAIHAETGKTFDEMVNGSADLSS